VNKAEIIAEIRALVGKCEVDSNDVSLSALAKDEGIQRQAMRNRMIPLVESGTWGTAIKFDPSQQRDIRVYWKIIDSTAKCGILEEGLERSGDGPMD
jgi:hypothetical protein